MKVFTLFFSMLLVFSVCATEPLPVTVAKKEKSKKTSKLTKKQSAKTADATAPCDSKEDILKKLEEKKKLQEEAHKGFSLQGGNTGCSVK